MSDFSIQKLTEADLEELYALACNTAELQVEKNKSEFWSPKVLADWLKSPDDLFLAIRDEATLVAFALVIYHPYLQEGYLSDLVIDPNYRRNGLASMLFEHIEQELKKRGCKSVWGIVQTSNGSMQGLLRNRGYRVGDQPFVYIDKGL